MNAHVDAWRAWRLFNKRHRNRHISALDAWLARPRIVG